jgi:hypothetical protein
MLVHKRDMMCLWIRSTLVILFLLCMATVVNAGDVRKDVWINAMSTALPTAFCQSNQYFRQCFEVSQIACEETASSATRICLNKYRAEIPDVLNQPKDGTHWGSIIGKCAGEAYEMALLKKRINSEACNNIANWQ